MTSEQLKTSLRAFLAKQTGADFERGALRASFNLRDMVRQRVQTTGIGPDGRPFEKYIAGYAKTRLKKGFQIRHVDYTRSGRLWGSIIPEVEQRTENGVVIAIGPRDEENRNKLRGPGTLTPRKDGVRRGLPTLPSADELSETFTVWVEEIIDDFEKSVIG